MKNIFLIFTLLFFLSACTLGESQQNMENTKLRDFESSLGTVSIPENPKRVYTDYYVGELLALDTNLVGADLTYTSSAWKDKLTDVVDTRQSLESVAALNPDLIITINQDLYDQYSKIAPTVYLEYGAFNPEKTLTLISDIVNKSKKAEKLLDNFHSKLDKTKKLIDNPNLTYSIIEPSDQELWVFGDNWGRGGYIIYNLLDLKGTKKAESSLIGIKESYLKISLESLQDYSGNVLILNTTETNSYFKELQENSLWKNLEGVKNKDVYIVDPDLFYFVDILSLEKQLEELDEIFSSKL